LLIGLKVLDQIILPATVHAGDTSVWYSDMMNDHLIAQAPDLNGDPNVLGY